MELQKLSKGDKVAVLSPSFAAPALFPQVYELGLLRLRQEFGLEPVEYPTTRKLNASTQERARDLIAAFEDPEIRAVIATIGGDDQVTYIYSLPTEPFKNNPKPFFGYSDNSHFCNFLFTLGIPSYYGGCLMTQFAMQHEMDEFTVEYLRHALFDTGEFELKASPMYNDQGHDWNDASLLEVKREQWPNEGWNWNGEKSARGRLWGGCLETIDDMLRCDKPMPRVEEFSNVVLMLETSEGIPEPSYVSRVMRALGERGILSNIQALLVGRPKAWEFDKKRSLEEKELYTKTQHETILKVFRTYNQGVPVIQNMNFGHTDPQIPMPYGKQVRIEHDGKRIFAEF